MRISILLALALVQLAVAVSPHGGSGAGLLVEMDLPPMPQKPVFVVKMAPGAPPCRIVADELGFEYLGEYGARSGKHLVTPREYMRVADAMGLFHDACEIEWGQLFEGPLPEPTPEPTPTPTPAPKCPNGTVAAANATAANATVAAAPGNATAAGNASIVAPKCVAVANTTVANATVAAANGTTVANGTVVAANGTLVPLVANTTMANMTAVNVTAANATAANATAANSTVANATLASDEEPVRKVAVEVEVEEFVAEPLEWAAVHLDRAACADAVAKAVGMTNLGPFDVHSRQYDAQLVLDKLALPSTVDPESLANDLYVFQKPADMYHSVAIDRLDAEPTVLWRVGPFGCEDA